MDQLHKRFTVDQVRGLLQGYRQGTMSRAEVEGMLNIGKTRFFTLLKEYQQSPAIFAITYERGTPARLSDSVEASIQKALLREKELMDDPRLPISDYNGPPPHAWGILAEVTRAASVRGSTPTRVGNTPQS